MLRYVIAIVLLFSLSFVLNGQTTYEGKLSDVATGELLVFVSIQLSNTKDGTISDLDGRFQLNAYPGDSLIFSYVGYEDMVIALEEETYLDVQLAAVAVSLTEIVVRPKENPAWRIIREVINNRQQNDPLQYPGYTYQAYHKTVLSVDTLAPVKRKQTAKRKSNTEQLRRDSVRQAVFQNDMHMWVTETSSENYFRAPQQRLEKILATQSSLPNDFTGGINPINFQPFGFYQEIIRLEFTQQNYVNPISNHPFKHYSFQLADTIIHANDTTYIIQFEPLKGKHFVALKGLLYVNTDGFALENVIAEPADPQQTLQFTIKQQCRKVDGKWFPEQLHADLFFQMGMGEALVVYGFRNRSVLSGINLQPPDEKVFNHYLKSISADVPLMYDSLRNLPLSRRERNTYVYWDSLPELRQPYRLLKAYNGLIKITASGLISTRIADVVVPDLLQFNAREGTRIGLGLKTSPDLFSYLSVYGYTAYGAKDESWKYGGTLEGKLYSHRDLRLRLSYIKDLIEPGGVDYLSASNQPWSVWSARSLILSRLDERKRYRTDLIYRPASAWQLNIFWQQEERQLSYDYSYIGISEPNQSIFTNQSYGLRLRYAPREQLVKMDQMEAILYPAYPIIDVALSHNKLTEEEGAFFRVSVRLEHEKNWKYLGVTEINLQSGWINRPVPYPYLFQSPGNAGNGFAGNGLFNSAGPTEFANEEYVYLFLIHRFGSLLGKTQRSYFRPELRLIQQIGWGRLHHSDIHQGIPFQDMRKAYLKSGIGIDNVLRIPYFKLIYLGLGGAVYYRWGSYRLPNEKDNFSFQLKLSFSV